MNALTPSSDALQRPGRRLRLALIVGFGLLLALLLVSGIDAIATLTQGHEVEQAARRDFLARNQAAIEMQRMLEQQFAPGVASLEMRMRSLVRNYPAQRLPEEDAMLQSLIVVVSQQQRFASGGATSCALVFPEHLRLIAAAQRIAAWDHRQFQGNDAVLLTQFDHLRTRLTRLLFLIVTSGLMIAVGSLVYISRQDREVRLRYAQLEQSRNALSHLSSRLIDAQEEERRSISRELHDEVGQSLGALLVDVGRLAALLPHESTRLQEHVRSMKALAEQSVQAVRNIALLLRPSMLDDLGLVAALEWQGREVSRRGELEVEVEASRFAEDLGEDYKICIFRLTQEALNNAARHSHGRHAWVNIGQTADSIILTIRDDGKGFDPERSRGLGLLGMEERVRNLGGKLEITSKKGEGALVAATLPIR